MKEFDTQKYYELALELTKELCKISAPSGLEEKRAEYIKNYLIEIGYKDAYVDSAKNVLWKLEGETQDYTLFMEHTDTVFPDLEPLPYEDDGTLIKCPGVCDDTVCVAIILSYCKYLKDIGFKAKNSILFSANACEEGLGNLKGVRQIFKYFAGKIKVMFTLDGGYNHIVNKSVGSHRYKITAETEGGHSFGAFGRLNSILVLSQIVNKIYQIEVPKKDGTKTTYNVGIINGGTSVNTIAQKAEMLCEYRSDDNDFLNYMKDKFNSIFDEVKAMYPDAKITIELVGDRPAMGKVDAETLEKYSKMVMGIQQKYTSQTVVATSGSTDCNIPHSLGVPAICVGVYEGKGVHTREEYLVKESVKNGVNIMNDLFNEVK